MTHVPDDACERCRLASADVLAYWGDPLCLSCAQTVAELLDSLDRWPDVPWSMYDEIVFDDGDWPHSPSH